MQIDKIKGKIFCKIEEINSDLRGNFLVLIKETKLFLVFFVQKKFILLWIPSILLFLIINSIAVNNSNSFLKKTNMPSLEVASLAIQKNFYQSVVGFVANKMTANDTQPSATVDEGINLIKNYYSAITDGDLERAYNMYGDKNVSFAEYEKWYGTAILAMPIAFNKIGDSRYQFYVIYYDKEAGKMMYSVVMEIKNGKINPISSEKVINSQAIDSVTPSNGK